MPLKKQRKINFLEIFVNKSGKLFVTKSKKMIGNKAKKFLKKANWGEGYLLPKNLTITP